MDFSWAETAAVTGFVYTHLVQAAVFSVLASSPLSSLASALYVCSNSMSGDTALWLPSALRPTKAPFIDQKLSIEVPLPCFSFSKTAYIGVQENPRAASGNCCGHTVKCNRSRSKNLNIAVTCEIMFKHRKQH